MKEEYEEIAKVFGIAIQNNLSIPEMLHMYVDIAKKDRSFDMHEFAYALEKAKRDEFQKLKKEKQCQE